MKIVICTTPIRSHPTDYPPFGSMAVIQALRRAGFDPYFYDIDGLRPDFAAVEKFFTEHQPDVVGISAVVSTAYGYTKKLSAMIRVRCPQARIVVGGNLAASAEILHRLAGIDYCCIGEGELVSVNLMRYLEAHPGRAKDEEALSAIKGLSYLRQDGEMAFTGYETALPADQVFNPDYSILERFSRIENFVNDPTNRPDFREDPRTQEPHRRGKKMITLVSAKGCVARCTFCHRWDKGYRPIPTKSLVEHLRFFKEKYDVGFVQFSDENFGSDRRQVEEFLEAMKSEDILYIVGGVRVRSVNPDLLRRMKESGCVALYYGMETGSPAILEMMEKKASLQDNINAAIWTKEAGLYTIYQLVIAMPGETEKTIAETTDFMCRATEILDEPPYERMSVNYIQALPGTPVYEYARHVELIGKSLLDEEAYLLMISDINAGDETKFLNFTPLSFLAVQGWRRRMMIEVTHNYLKMKNLPPPRFRDVYVETILKRYFPERYKTHHDALRDQRNSYTEGGYFNLQNGLHYQLISGYFYWARTPIAWTWLLVREYQRLPLRVFLGHVAEHVGTWFRPAPPPIDYKSLRKIMQDCAPKPLTPTEAAMVPLREGR
jgi:anaerobic magnesium-protoporphyrin IX monomethyl ester cyclase